MSEPGMTKRDSYRILNELTNQTRMLARVAEMLARRESGDHLSREEADERLRSCIASRCVHEAYAHGVMLKVAEECQAAYSDFDDALRFWRGVIGDLRRHYKERWTEEIERIGAAAMASIMQNLPEQPQPAKEAQ